MINYPFTHEDYEIAQREVLYQGTFRMVRNQVRFRLFNGEFSPIVTREVMERTSAAGVLPYDPVQDKVILIEQFRIGAIANPPSPWLLEVVAGILDTEESPLEVSRREAREEAGCEVLDLYPICEYFVSPGGSNEYFHLYCGRINANLEEGIFGLSEEHENIRAISLPVEEALSLLQAGQLKTPPAIIALQWLQLNREWLKQLWLTK